jgi:hypothetical protein
MVITFWILGTLGILYLTITLGFAWLMRKPRY